MLTDKDITIIRRDGTEYHVVYPNRVGREYETPWLDTAGSREWNIDIMESLHNPPTKGNPPRFIIGKWGTGYADPDGVETIIPFQDVLGIKDLPPDLKEQSIQGWTREEKALEEQAHNNSNRYVRFEELKQVLERINRLEEKVG